jgi:hypothetical protein
MFGMRNGTEGILNSHMCMHGSRECIDWDHGKLQWLLGLSDRVYSQRWKALEWHLVREACVCSTKHLIGEGSNELR